MMNSMTSLDDMAKRCFEGDLTLRLDGDRKIGGCLAVAAIVVLGTVVASAAGLNDGGTALVFVVTCILGVPIWRAISAHPEKTNVYHRLKLFRGGDIETMMHVYSFAVDHFRKQIQSHRARTIGTDSEWGKAREKLASTLDECRQQVAYWRLRLEADEGNQMARRQYAVSAGLEAKMNRALRKLDGRADVLLKFYSECEARVAALDHCNQDIAKTRQLESLSDRADFAIAEAEGTLAGIGQQFAREAEMVWRAMAGLGEVQAFALASETSIDDMDFLADRVIERSERDEKTIRDLEDSLSAPVLQVHR